MDKETDLSVLPIELTNGIALDMARAREIGESLAGEYCFADPFPHIVLDNFLPTTLAKLALAELP